MQNEIEIELSHHVRKSKVNVMQKEIDQNYGMIYETFDFMDTVSDP